MNNIPLIIATNLIVIGLAIRLGWELCSIRIIRKVDAILDTMPDPTGAEDFVLYYHQGWLDAIGIILHNVPPPMVGWVGEEQEKGGVS